MSTIADPSRVETFARLHPCLMSTAARLRIDAIAHALDRAAIREGFADLVCAILAHAETLQRTAAAPDETAAVLAVAQLDALTDDALRLAETLDH